MVSSRGSNNEVVVDALRNKGFHVNYVEDVRIPKLSKIAPAHVVYGAFLQTCNRYIAAAQVLHKKTMIHFVGSDAYRYAREKGLRKLYYTTLVHACDRVFYVSEHLTTFVRRQGAILPLPIRVSLFDKAGHASRERDVLYYCPSGAESERIYRLDWILAYAKTHPDEKITILGNVGHPAEYRLDLRNVEVIPFVRYEQIVDVYNRHKRLVRMTTQDGLPRMIDEALLSGMEVIFNGRVIDKVPPERDPVEFADRFEQELSKIL
jgi:hypothetical protein